MSEGWKRRRMASKILAVAIDRRIKEGSDGDWILGGDFNAPLASEDFRALISADMAPLSAQDEAGGAFSYIKRSKSLIDHIFLSPNLAQNYGAEDFFIVAADRSFPSYLKKISDHRPVLVRLSLNGRQKARPELSRDRSDEKNNALRELRDALGGAPIPYEPARDSRERVSHIRVLDVETLEALRPEDYRDRHGYREDFLGTEERLIPLPTLSERIKAAAAVLDPQSDGADKFNLKYTHFSVVMNAERKLAFYAAANVDGNSLRRIPRSGRWITDSRLPRDHQAGNELYKHNDLDRGHLIRRLDPVWGPRDEAVRANNDTFHYTNASPQHKDFNQITWLELEDYILDNTDAHDLKISVFTGPVFRPDDQVYRSIQLPREFWKIVALAKASSGSVSATGYLLSQADLLTDLEAFVFGPFKTYQVPITQIERLSGLDFGKLRASDPLRDGLETIGKKPVRLITGPDDLVR
jgi:DNA/RNA endonuclease G (NUC1)